MATFHKLIAAGTPGRRAAALTGISRSEAREKPRVTPLSPVRRRPHNRLSKAEREQVLATLNCDRFADMAPPAVYATLLSEGTYLCSISTMYRILRENKQVTERRRLARHPARTVPELQATAPNQVYSWDITKLKGPTKGVYFQAYVMIDIYSRYIVGVKTYKQESSYLAEEMMREVFDIHGIPEVVHADRGASMTSKPVSVLLADLGVTRSHSRPRVSNDNPYSEAWFKTCKYGLQFPSRFADLSDARRFMAEFVDYYNHSHRHGGIGFHTPADVHFGTAVATDQRRAQVLAKARQLHPERFTAKVPIPKILERDPVAYINKPVGKENTPGNDLRQQVA